MRQRPYRKSAFTSPKIRQIMTGYAPERMKAFQNTGIDEGHVGSGKFGVKNTGRVLNNRRA